MNGGPPELISITWIGRSNLLVKKGIMSSEGTFVGSIYFCEFKGRIGRVGI